MDPELIFIECATLAFNVYLFSLFYKLYKSRETCLKSLKKAQRFEINAELPEKVKNSGGVVPYAVVSGNVKALSRSLRSQNISSVRGVIRENLMLRMWNALQFSMSSVPFAVYGRTSDLFKKQVCVEIVDPLMADELTLPRIYHFITSPLTAEARTLPTVYDVFYDDTNVSDPFIEAVCVFFDFFRGERTIGILENMLVEDSALTAVGKLIIDKNKIKIMPPDVGLNYFVTPLTLNSLIKKVSDSARLSKIFCIISGAVSLYWFVCVVERSFKKIQQQRNRAQRLKEMEEARRLRIIADSTRNLQATYNNGSKCVVCSENPVEIFITECGHACLCLNCSLKIRDVCPVCRSKFLSSVQIFLP